MPPLLPPFPQHTFQVLCIDEATASVDQKTDQLLQQTICKRFANKTVLTIAHRCASIQNKTNQGLWWHGPIACPQYFQEPKDLGPWI